ncbi:MAG: hypothetical protein WC998_06020 [Candidatus Paceibacterota bacterium]|jgi:hypothetical protein
MDLSYLVISNIQKGLKLLTEQTEDSALRNTLIKENKFTPEEFFDFSYLVTRFIKLTAPIADSYIERKNGLLIEFGIPEVVNDKQTGTFNISHENVPLYNAASKKLNEQIETITNVRKIKLSELQKLSVSSAILLSLDPIIESDIEISF